MTAGRSASDHVQGFVDEGFGPVADAFMDNFTERGEIGGACTIYQHGVKVVDIWGGYRDGERHTPWHEDTMVTVFSTTKGVAGLLCARARSAGLFDYDAPMSNYWPEFAQNGKEGITVAEVLGHRAGLSALDSPISVDDIENPVVLDAKLAEARPRWEPSTRHGYHASTLGFYEAALLRRVDPQHRSLGTILADEVTGPRGIDFFIGVPRALAQDRLARFHGFDNAELADHLDEMPPAFVEAMLDPESLTFATFNTNQASAGMNSVNDRDILALELPAGNGTGEVRALAELYADAIGTGPVLDISQATLGLLTAPAVVPTGGLMDAVLRIDTNYSLGFWKPFPGFRFGSADGRAFGTPGAGGSFAFGDPTTGVAFAYAPNRAGFRVFDDPREVALREALFVSVLGEAGQHPDTT